MLSSRGILEAVSRGLIAQPDELQHLAGSLVGLDLIVRDLALEVVTDQVLVVDLSPRAVFAR